MKHYKFLITFKSEILLGQPKTPTASRRSRSLVFAVWCMAPSCMNMAGPATGGCQGVAQPRTSSKFHQAVMFALDLDQWQFAITGKIPQHHDGNVCVDMSSLDTGRMDMFKGTFLTPSGFALWGLPGANTSYCPSGDIKDLTNGCSFYARHWSPYYTPSLSIGRTYCGYLEEILTFKRHGRSEFMGHGCKTTGSITMKHGKNGVEVSTARCKSFHKNTINLLNLISLSKQTWFWKIRLFHILIAVHIGLIIWHHFVFCENVVLLPNHIVSKIENIPPIGKFSKIKNK